MNSFLTSEFRGYPAAKNLIPIFAFTILYDQRVTLLQKNVINGLILNILSIKKWLTGLNFIKY
jgi:hypothetical protein